MSVQFGKCNFDRKPIDPEDLDQVRPVLAPYGPDGEGFICRDNFAALYRAFHTTKESRREVQPHVCPSGAVLVWDGRLDNRGQLIKLLAHETSPVSTDLDIVAAAYERWGLHSFAHLIGDWSLSIWDGMEESLVLAKDFLGSRHLYYSVKRNEITWCSVIDPLVLHARHSFVLSEEYLAGYLSQGPATHLTPYVGINSVPASCFVRWQRGKQDTIRYWDFDHAKRIRYRTDHEYEEHFRAAFGEACRRRLRSETPILAELSGGVDSSSIVCTVDRMIAQGQAPHVDLNTVSYFDDTDPDWNERPYFTSVERQRGKTGCHIDVAEREDSSHTQSYFAAFPGSVDDAHPSNARDKLMEYVATHKNRVVLSGVGGDEVTGGVPTAIPELRDLIVTGQLRNLTHQLKAWALIQRKPWMHLLLEAASGFFPTWIANFMARPDWPRWLDPRFFERNCRALQGYETTIKVAESLPSFQENLKVLDGLRRQFSCCYAPSRPLLEVRHPYLDRDLLEFVYALPREQIVRPGQRRSLMRRALAGIVPEEVLNRRRKAFASRGAINVITTEWTSLRKISRHLIAESIGMISGPRFVEAVQRAGSGQEAQPVPLMRMLAIEYWLRSLG